MSCSPPTNNSTTPMFRPCCGDSDFHCAWVHVFAGLDRAVDIDSAVRAPCTVTLAGASSWCIPAVLLFFVTISPAHARPVRTGMAHGAPAVSFPARAATPAPNSSAYHVSPSTIVGPILGGLVAFGIAAAVLLFIRRRLRGASLPNVTPYAVRVSRAPQLQIPRDTMAAPLVVDGAPGSAQEERGLRPYSRRLHYSRRLSPLDLDQIMDIATQRLQAPQRPNGDDQHPEGSNQHPDGGSQHADPEPPEPRAETIDSVAAAAAGSPQVSAPERSYVRYPSPLSPIDADRIMELVARLMDGEGTANLERQRRTSVPRADPGPSNSGRDRGWWAVEPAQEAEDQAERGRPAGIGRGRS